ncbi:MAG TPA: hypothetical protein VFL86_02515, partial [Burkholderiaceae bacterium]|nr:hypothetical protein [Burkholderiaceae bacterium]
MSRIGSLMAGVVFAVSLAACGGNDEAPVAAPPAGPPVGPSRGSLIDARVESDLSIPKEAVDILTRLADLSALTGKAQCNVDVHSVRYNTRDPLNEPHTASAAILLPTGGDPAVCEGTRPMLLYARGTDVKKSKNMVDWEKEAESALMIAFFASHGFIVVLPNYLGHDTSSLP